MATSSSLALHGGDPTVVDPIPAYSSIGGDERAAVNRVMASQSLSGFYGSWGPEFLGGEEVKSFEAEWSVQFSVPHAVSVNSATSGLIAALGAIGLSPGDEVIVPPYTMSATAIAPLFYGGIPVFADVELETFCINVDDVKRLITPKTRAIIAVNLFGHPAKLHELAALAKEHGLYLIEDNAQAPLAQEYGVYTGTLGDIGVFSLNYHKHIHTGEGGMCVTHIDELALRLQAIRNHAENITEHCDLGSMANMIGQNYRMTELSAAVGRAQLKKIDQEVGFRQDISQSLSDGIGDLDGLTVPMTRTDCSHSFYIWCLRVDQDKLGVTRNDFSLALAAEGFPHFQGYVRPLYNLPVFKKKIAIGAHGWPFTLTDRIYHDNMCPAAERLCREEALLFETCAFNLNESLIAQLIESVRKVYTLRSEIVR